MPAHAQVLLSVRAFEEYPDATEDCQSANLGMIWLHGIAKQVLKTVNARVSARNLNLIGHDRLPINKRAAYAYRREVR